MNDATLIFEILLRNNLFMDKIDNLIKKTQELKDIPRMVLFIIELLEQYMLHCDYNIKLSVREMYKLLELYRIYILSKFEKDTNVYKINTKEFIDNYNTCAKLSVKKIKLIKKINFFCC